MAAAVLVDNRSRSDSELEKSMTGRLRGVLEAACARRGAQLLVAHDCAGVREIVASGVPVRAVVLSGSAHNVSQGVAMADLSHAAAVLMHFPHAPVLGVCFGHQLLAVLCGGRVARMDRAAVGWHPLAGQQQPRYLNHQDVVTELPPGFRATCADGAGRIMGMAGRAGGRGVVGVQYHPEADPAGGASEVEEFLAAALGACED